MSSPSAVGNKKMMVFLVVDVSVSRHKMSGFEVHLLLYQTVLFDSEYWFYVFILPVHQLNYT